MDDAHIRRRNLLTLGLAGTAALAAGAYLASRWTDGQPVARIRDARLLSASAQLMLARVTEAVLDGILPENRGTRDQAIDRTLAELEAGLAAMPSHVVQQLQDVFSLLGAAPSRVLVIGRWGGWANASTQEVQALLHNLRHSALGLRRLVYATLHDLCTGSFYAQADNWHLIGYPGPLVPGPGEEV